MSSQKQEIKFLESYLKDLRHYYEILPELCYPDDFAPVPVGEVPTTSPDEERVARLADDNGFDGSLFRDLTGNGEPNPTSLRSIRRLSKKIETIPKIITKIQKPVDRSVIPDGAELLTVPQVARILNWGESVVRQRDKEGLLPSPIRTGGTIQWNKQELKNWMKQGCPPRQKWEEFKQANRNQPKITEDD